MSVRAWIGLGTNVGDREANLARALDLLAERVRVVARSPLYETEPVGYRDQPWFLNCVAEVEVEGDAGVLHAATKQVERTLGKATPFPDGPRIIDLDLLLFGDESIERPDLRVPHPRMHGRRFVLAPLADLAPDQVIPGTGRTVRQALDELPPAEAVRPYAEGPRDGGR